MKLTPLFVALALTGAALPSPAAETPPVPAPASTLDALFEDKVLAKGKGVEVKQSELDEAFGELRAAFAARKQSIPDGQRPVAEYRLLERLVASKLFTAIATEADRTEAASRYEKVLEETMKRFSDEAAFERQLKFSGSSRELFKTKTLEQLLWQAVLDRNLKSKINVPDDAVAKFYKDNPSKFEKPEMVRASHILISTVDTSKNPPPPLSDEVKAERLAKAKMVKERADKGEDFAALAKEFSEDPGSKDKGGEYTFPRGQMVKPFEDAAFTLPIGKVSDLVETPFGFHIIKTSEKIPAEVTPLDKVKDDIRKFLEAQEIQKLIPDYVEQLKKEYGVEILVPMPEELKNQPATAAPKA